MVLKRIDPNGILDKNLIGFAEDTINLNDDSLFNCIGQLTYTEMIECISIINSMPVEDELNCIGSYNIVISTFSVLDDMLSKAKITTSQSVFIKQFILTQIKVWCDYNNKCKNEGIESNGYGEHYETIIQKYTDLLITRSNEINELRSRKLSEIALKNA